MLYYVSKVPQLNFFRTTLRSLLLITGVVTYSLVKFKLLTNILKCWRFICETLVKAASLSPISTLITISISNKPTTICYQIIRWMKTLTRGVSVTKIDNSKICSYENVILAAGLLFLIFPKQLLASPYNDHCHGVIVDYVISICSWTGNSLECTLEKDNPASFMGN